MYDRLANFKVLAIASVIIREPGHNIKKLLLFLILN